MYKVANNIAPSYLINLFQMRSTSDDTITSLRLVTNKNFLIPKPKYLIFLRTVCLIQGLSFGIVQYSIGNQNIEIT